jgi:hypothetical protein
MAAWSYYQFKDATQQLVLFGASLPDEQLHANIMRKAAELEIPVSAEQVTVKRDGFRTRAHAAYVQPVEVFPNYRYPVDFAFDVESLSITGAR